MSVLTTQAVTISLAAGVTSNTAALSGITDITQCVPMTTKRVTTADSPADQWGEYCVRVEFLTGPDRVQCTTEGAGAETRATQIEIDVWEFDGTDDVVDSGQIVDSSSQSWNDTIALAGAVTDAFLVFSWSSTSSNTAQ